MTTTQWICLILLLIFLSIFIWYLGYAHRKMNKQWDEGNKTACFEVLSDSMIMYILLGYFIAIGMLGTFGLLFTPTAMDVYEGKTELQYTIRNGEIIDSIAVYKKIYEKIEK